MLFEKAVSGGTIEVRVAGYAEHLEASLRDRVGTWNREANIAFVARRASNPVQPCPALDGTETSGYRAEIQYWDYHAFKGGHRIRFNVPISQTPHAVLDRLVLGAFGGARPTANEIVYQLPEVSVEHDSISQMYE